MKDVHRRAVAGAIVIIAASVVSITSVPAVSAAPAERPIEEDLVGYLTGMEFAPGFLEGDVSGSTFDGRCSATSHWISTMSGTGVVSHLGRVSWTTEHCYEVFGNTFGDAELVITAANGDQLFGTYDGVMTGETTFAEAMTVTGGTGRFSGAEGSVDETGWFDPVTGYMEISGVGSIVYDASVRAFTP